MQLLRQLSSVYVVQSGPDNLVRCGSNRKSVYVDRDVSAENTRLREEKLQRDKAAAIENLSSVFSELKDSAASSSDPAVVKAAQKAATTILTEFFAVRTSSCWSVVTIVLFSIGRSCREYRTGGNIAVKNQAISRRKKRQNAPKVTKVNRDTSPTFVPCYVYNHWLAT